MMVVTVANGEPQASYYTYHEFFASLRRFGHLPLVLSEGYAGLGSKPKMLKRAIEDGQIPYQRMIFCDCFDVVFAMSPEKIDERAQRLYGQAVVWNAERNCFPDAGLFDKHPPASSSFRFLNSGFGIGRTSDFLAMLNWMKADEIPDDYRDENGAMHHENDQDYWMRALCFSGMNIRVDDRATLCQTLCGVSRDDLDLDGDLIRNRETNSHPGAFHFNGPSKTEGLRGPILEKLGL